MKEHGVFPWWAGYLLLSPLRKLSMDPDSLLRAYIRPGMTVLDAGCAMGYFSIPMAGMTGPGGRVICVDPQKRMLAALDRRAGKHGVSAVIETRLCTFNSLRLDDLNEKVDVALAFGVLHETGNKKRFAEELGSSIRQGGVLVFGEPHVVSEKDFREELGIIEQAGFVVKETFRKGRNTLAVLYKTTVDRRDS